MPAPSPLHTVATTSVSTVRETAAGVAEAEAVAAAAASSTAKSLPVDRAAQLDSHEDNHGIQPNGYTKRRPQQVSTVEAEGRGGILILVDGEGHLDLHPPTVASRS